MRKHETSATDIGQRLKAVRKRLHVQQQEMAAALKVASSYLSEIENGKGNPGPEFFVRLATQFNINLNYLFMGAPDMFIDACARIYNSLPVQSRHMQFQMEGLRLYSRGLHRQMRGLHAKMELPRV
jgi:transcriptional regulator with XRE-family HTH domain